MKEENKELLYTKIEYEKIDIRSSQIKKQIEEEHKKPNANKLFENIDEILNQGSLLHLKNFSNMSSEEKRKERKYVMCLIANVLNHNGIPTVVYKNVNDSNYDANEAIQQLCSEAPRKHKFKLKFDFNLDGKKINEQILEDSKSFMLFSYVWKLKISKAIGINPDFVQIINPVKGSVEVDVILYQNNEISQEELENKLKDPSNAKNIIEECLNDKSVFHEYQRAFSNFNQEDFINKVSNTNCLRRIQKLSLIEACKLHEGIFDPRHDRDKGWCDPKRGGEDYIHPDGFFGYGLNVYGKFDNGNNDWISYDEGIQNQYAIAYLPIRYDLKNSCIALEKLKRLTDNFAPNRNDEDYTFEEENNARRSGSKCKKGCYLYQNIKIAEANAQPIPIGPVSYKIILMCRVDPKKIRVPERFPKVWILNGNSKEIRQYRILVKVNQTTVRQGELKISRELSSHYKELMLQKNRDFFLKNNQRNRYTNEEYVVRRYTGKDEYKSLNNFLRTNTLDKENTELSIEELKSWVYCLHTVLTSPKDFNSKLKKVENGTRVYRGLDISFDTSLKEGEEFQFADFVSTSLSKKQAMDFGQKTFFTIIIQNNGTNGMPIYCYNVEDVSVFPYEKEVIITANTTFYLCKVQEIIIEGEKRHNVLLICKGYKAFESGSGWSYGCSVQ